MSKSNTTEDNILKAIFNATAIANLLDNAASTPNTVLWFALHTADPGEGGTQATSECTYTSYARQSVARTTGGFTIASGAVSLVADLFFPAATGGTETASFWSVGMASSGASVILYSGTLTPNVAIATGVQPKIASGQIITED